MLAGIGSGEQGMECQVLAGSSGTELHSLECALAAGLQNWSVLSRPEGCHAPAVVFGRGELAAMKGQLHVRHLVPPTAVLQPCCI